jgi:hypothetical protein
VLILTCGFLLILLADWNLRFSCLSCFSWTCERVDFVWNREELDADSHRAKKSCHVAKQTSPTPLIAFHRTDRTCFSCRFTRIVNSYLNLASDSSTSSTAAPPAAAPTQDELGKAEAGKTTLSICLFSDFLCICLRFVYLFALLGLSQNMRRL